MFLKRICFQCLKENLVTDTYFMCIIKLLNMLYEIYHIYSEFTNFHNCSVKLIFLRSNWNLQKDISKDMWHTLITEAREILTIKRENI